MGTTCESPHCGVPPVNFRYGRYMVEPTPGRPGVSVVYRPIIPLRVVGTAGGATVYGLLDTGADETLLPQVVSDLVGIVVDPRHTGTILSASGEMTVTYGTVILEFGQGRERQRWQTMVGVVQQPWQEALLGHAGFLRYFDVTFLGGKREVRLSRNKVPFGTS